METSKCKKHGIYTKEEAYVCKTKNPNYKDGIYLRCKKCCHDKRIRQYQKNRVSAIAYSAKWKKENRERINLHIAQDKINNREKYVKWRKDYYERNKIKINSRAICRYHSIDINSYESMFEFQNSQCAICGKEETRIRRGKVMRLCVDHDHATGKIRALLCHDCNSGLGKFYDCPDLLTKAAIYLMDHK